MNKIFKNRTNKLQNEIKNNQSILLSSSSDISYFTNFNFLVPEERESLLFITKNSVNLIHTSFSPINNYSHIKYLKGSFPNQLANHIDKIIKEENIEKILIDKNTLFVAELNAIKDKINILIEDYETTLIQNFRNTKEISEIDKIKKACEITSQIMTEIKDTLKPGITEIEVKKLIKKSFESYGADQLAFPTIVAFGQNSALPHHQPSSAKLDNEMPILIDMGARFDGYCSDMTRTFWFGENPSKKFLEIQKVVRAAYREAFKKLTGKLKMSSKIRAKDIDNAARVLISNKGYSQNFIHTTGHGLGLSIHEQPSISWSNKTEIVPNMVITIEPGIYLKGDFGYRYENTVLVKENGASELTTSSHSLS
jgi:Xaa-Pro aminopeptidase